MAVISKLKRSVAYDTSSLNLTTRTVALAASSTTSRFDMVFLIAIL